MRRAVLTGIGCLALACAAGLALAPQVPALLREGFPPPVWDTSLAVVEVAGLVPAAAPVPPALPGAAKARFVEAGGRALLVARNGAVVAGGYGGGVGPETRLNSYSLVKSLVGLLVLRAVAEGRIASLDLSLVALLGRDAPDVPLRSVMTMTSGLAVPGAPPKEAVQKPVDDASYSPFSPVGALHVYGVERLLPDLAPDPARAGHFQYQSVNTALLGLVVERAFAQPLQEVLADVIWRPAGAAAAVWRQNPGSGRASAYCCLYATAADWVKVASYLVTNGTPDAPLLPQALWQDWIAPDLPASALRRGQYGLHVRHDVLDRVGEALQGRFTYLMGHGGQVVYLLPDQGAVVVRFGETPQLLHSTLYELAPVILTTR